MFSVIDPELWTLELQVGGGGAALLSDMWGLQRKSQRLIATAAQKKHIPRQPVIGCCTVSLSTESGIQHTHIHTPHTHCTHTHRRTFLFFIEWSETSREMRPRDTWTRQKVSLLRFCKENKRPDFTWSFCQICSETWLHPPTAPTH